MKIHESTWKNPDGVNLYTRRWQPETSPNAAVVLVHGLGEHCARYDHVAAAFTDHGIDVFSFDLRGHGRSKGVRGHIPSFESVCRDIDHFLSEAAASDPKIPVFLYGHSLGGLLILVYILTRHPKIKGVIASGPSLGTDVPIPAVKRAFGKWMYRLAPSVTVPNGLDLNNLSHDPAVIQAYKADPLVTRQVSARLGLDLLAMGGQVADRGAEIDLPLLLMQGSGDHLVSPPATRKFAAGVQKQWITYREWEGLYHELHNEPQKQQVIQVILDWIDQQIGA